MSKIIYFLFVAHLVLLAYLNNFYLAGVPVRSFLILMAGVLIILHQKEIVGDLAFINTIYLFLMIYGLAISLIKQVSVGSIINGELKLLQSYLVIVSSYYIIKNLGFRPLSLALLSVAVLSAVVGILQGVGVDFAWGVHDWLVRLQNVPAGSIIFELTARPPGLALFAIPQTYLLLSGLIVGCYFVLSSISTKQQLWVLLVNSVLLLGILSSATRSAIGAAVFILACIYLYRFRGKAMLLFMLFVLVGGIYFIIGLNSGEVDSRLLSLGDQSAKGRSTLYKYGIELFLQNPLGYGFNFDTVKHAFNYFVNDLNIFSYGPDEKAQYLVPIHNSIINLSHTFGIAGLFVLASYLFWLAKPSWYRLVFILGSLINSAFHNAGILSGDLFIDIVIGILIYESRLKTMRLSRP